MLLAGVNFLGAIQDALTGFPVTAGARILEAFLATAGVVAGVSGGLRVADVLGVDLGRLEPRRLLASPTLPVMVVGGAVAAAAYAFAAYAPRRALAPIGGGGRRSRSRCTPAPTTAGSASPGPRPLAALLLGLVGYPVAARTRIPTLVVVAAGITPFLPGLSIYRGLTLLATDSSKALVAMVTAAAIAIALSSGAILGEYLAQPIRREARRLESQARRSADGRSVHRARGSTGSGGAGRGGTGTRRPDAHGNVSRAFGPRASGRISLPPATSRPQTRPMAIDLRAQGFRHSPSCGTPPRPSGSGRSSMARSSPTPRRRTSCGSRSGSSRCTPSPRSTCDSTSPSTNRGTDPTTWGR